MTSSTLRDVAVILAAHGDTSGETPNAALLSHASALAAKGYFRHVGAGTLKTDDLPLEIALSAARASGAARIAVYPMFMADGYFTGKVLPQRIAAAGLSLHCKLIAPLGLDPQMPGLMMSHALTIAERSAIEPTLARLLVVGHGSKFGRASLHATEKVASRLRQIGRFAFVETAYLEETPFLSDQLKYGGLTTLVTGFFSGEGMHASQDVPDAIAAAGTGAHYAGAIGGHPEIAQIIETAVRAAYPTAGTA